jgi:MFS family permease
MQRKKLNFLFLNLGHFFDHLFMLIFASVAALRLNDEWGMSYAELIPYATPGFVAFGVCAILAGWIADKWSRAGMIVIFFIGIGLSSILAGMASSPLQIAAGLSLIGVFAAIYHPVGLAMVVHGRARTGIPLAINGIFGNMGVASAALLTGFLIDNAGWRSAFYLPGVISILLGLAYLVFISSENAAEASDAGAAAAGKSAPASKPRHVLLRVFAIIFFTTAIGGLIFQSTTFALPKIFAERLSDFAGTATRVGWYAFLVFSLAALAQLVVFDPHGVRDGGDAAGYFFRRHDAAQRNRGAGGIDRLHVCGVRPDSDQRRTGRTHGAQRVAQPRLCHPLRGDLLGNGFGGAADRLGARQLGIRAPVPDSGFCRGDDLRRHAAAARLRNQATERLSYSSPAAALPPCCISLRIERKSFSQRLN